MNKKIYQHLSEKSWEKILKWIICEWTWEEFPIFEKEVELMEKISPVFWWKKFNFPLPKLWPKARAIKRMLFRNERSLYKRKSDLSWDNILSIYPESFEWKVYSVAEYNSDKFEASKYWINFDENKNIKEQIKEFYQNIPKKATNLDDSIWMENCDYCNFWMGSKDSYMSQAPIASQNCLYSYTPLYSNNIIDWHFMTQSENCYDSIWCSKCYKVFYSQSLEESSDCYFSFNLVNCKNCIWCVDLNWKDYHILNKKVEKKEFEEKLKNIFSSYENVEQFKKEFEEFKENIPKESVMQINSEKCFWSGFQNSNNVLLWFDTVDLDNWIYNILSWMTTNNVYDTYAVWVNVSYVFNSIWISNSTSSAFWEFSLANNSYYFRDCRNIENCLFSYWLRNKEFCIFNKQYTKKEYEILAPKIIQKLEDEWIWWEFFETEVSDFPYNDSVADIFYPVKKLVFLDENKNILKTEINDKNGEGVVYILESDKFISKAILDLWWKVKINIKYRTKNNKIELPKNMQDVVICEQSKRPFRLLKQEKEFYKKYNIPNPKLHPDIRFKNRINKRNKFELFLKECEDCKEETLTAWEKEKIVCEKCYEKEIY